MLDHVRNGLVAANLNVINEHSFWSRGRHHRCCRRLVCGLLRGVKTWLRILYPFRPSLGNDRRAAVLDPQRVQDNGRLRFIGIDTSRRASEGSAIPPDT